MNAKSQNYPDAHALKRGVGGTDGDIEPLQRFSRGAGNR
jgi:hypothetical protein